MHVLSKNTARTLVFKRNIRSQIDNRDTHLYPPHSSIHVTTTEVRRTGRIIDGMRSSWTTARDTVFAFPMSSYTLLEWPSQEERGSSLTVSAPMTDDSAPACTNGVWPPLRTVSVAQKNRSLTMLSFNVQTIDVPMYCAAWRWDTLEWLLNICPEI